MFNRICANVIRWRVLVILLVLGMTVGLMSQIKHLKVIIDPNQMLPQSHPYVIGTNLAEKVFGSNYVLVIAVSPKQGDIFQRDVLEKVRKLSDGIQTLPHVKPETMMSLSAKRAKSITGVDDGLEVKPLLPAGELDRETIAKVESALKRNPLYTGAAVSEKRDMAAISIAVEKGPHGFTPTLKAAQELIAANTDANVQISMSGTPMFIYYVEKYTQRMALLFPVALLLVGLLHLEAFRTWQGFFLPLVTAFLSVLWGLGLMGIAKVPLDAFNVITPILILAVTAGHAVQLLKRYYEEFDGAIRQGLEPKAANREAVLRSITKVGPVMLAAGLVAVFGFFSLMSFNVATIRNFGVFTGLGILSGLVIELTFIPAVRSCLKPPKIRTKAPRFDIWGPIVRFISQAATAQSKAKVYVFFLCLIGAAGFGLSQLKVENSNKSFFSSALPFQADDRLINERLGGTNTLYVVFEGDRNDAIKDPAVLKLIEDTQQFLEKQPGVGKTISIVDLLRRMNQAMHGEQAKDAVIPENRNLVSQYLLLYSMSGEPADFDRYVDYNYRYANITAFVKYDSSAYIQKVIANTKTFLDQHPQPGIRIHFGGSVPQSTALSETLVEGKLKNILQLGLVILVVSTLVFRSALAGLLIITPLAITALSNYGIMGLLGIPLNTPNATTAPMAVGIGADYAIYLLYRIREELAVHADIREAVRAALGTAGRAILYVASAISGGYAVLMLSHGFNVHIWTGFLIVLSMTISAFTTLLLLSSIVVSLNPSFMHRAAAGNRKLASGVGAGVATLLMIGVVATTSSPAKASEADSLMQKNYLANRMKDSVSNATFNLINKNGDKRVRETWGATKMQDGGDDNRRITRFLSPSDIRNTVTLMVEHSDRDDDIWVYLPALKKTRRLSASSKNESFVGTDLSYGDVIGHRVADWNHKLTGNAALNGATCSIVESLPANKEVATNTGYAKRVSWIDGKSFLALKTEFFDLNNQLLKVATMDKIENVDTEKGRWQPMHMEVRNVQTGHTTVIDWRDFKANQGVKDSYFTTRYLEKEE